jgi:hypothetical protein
MPNKGYFKKLASQKKHNPNIKEGWKAHIGKLSYGK